jgi:outer membrane protein OmpA-like peptidoglycan-associated protein
MSRYTASGMRMGIAAILVASAIAANAAPKDHPLIKPYPGSILTSSEDRGFSEFKFVTGANPTGATDDDQLPNIQVSGTLTQLAYESPGQRSLLEVATNYKEALERAGFQILFTCGGSQCEPVRQAVGRLNGTRYTSPDMRFLTASLKRGDQETYVQINMIAPRHEIYVLERTEMERGLVVVTPEAIKQGLLAEGRVVLDGILFDHDKATLKAESKPALDAIAGFLAENPTLKAYIVGHTDGTGQLAYNLRLSEDRAAAVVNALVTDYGVARGRLAAYGVGPLAPARTNKDENGRNENRRVEMVEM